MTVRSRTAVFGVTESPQGVLLVANRRRRGKVDWTPPGGMVDRGESSLEALSREVEEESGLMATEWPTLLYTAEVQFREIAQPPKAKPKPKKTKPLVFPAWPPPAVEPEPSPRPCDGLSCPDLVCVADLHFDTEMLWDLGPIARASLEGMSPGGGDLAELYDLDDGIYVAWSENNGWNALGKFGTTEEATEKWRTWYGIDEDWQEGCG